MIIYSGTLNTFHSDVFKGIIADKIQELFEEHGFNHNNEAEYRAWENSLRVMSLTLGPMSGINQEINVAVEYQIPLTSKRVDFLLTGQDDNEQDNVVIIELKQWESCEATSRDDVVTTYLNQAIRAVTHPSYQAYSYAKAIESFNQTVRDDDIGLYPCAFLHNYKVDPSNNIFHTKYSNALTLAPCFLRSDGEKLQKFIKKYITKPDKNGTILYRIEQGKIKPSIALQDAITSLMDGNEVFTMIDEQKVAYSTIMKLVESTIGGDKKHTVIIQGGPGTGKTVIAVNLLSKLIRKGYNTAYVTKNAAPRSVFTTELINGDFKRRYVENLFKGSGAFYDAKSNTYDCLLADEAHRLNAKSGIFKNKGENQIKEIINASKISVFFIDEAQVVTTDDIGSIEEITKWAKILGSEVHVGEDFVLSSQFRCGGSDGYLAFLDNLLGIRETANIDLVDIDYDVQVIDDPNELRRIIIERNSVNNKSRLLAGYCYEWKSKNNPNVFDIKLENGFEAQWNFSNTSTWAIDPDSIDQVGCIHTSQGLEFDYVGVIIGKDLYFDGTKVQTNFLKRASSDRSLSGIKTSKNYELADKIIRNTYRTLLSRGQKGCYIYCEDKLLAKYIRNKIAK